MEDREGLWVVLIFVLVVVGLLAVRQIALHHIVE